MKLIKRNDMFTQSCFIKKNNKTLLKCLERMGYKSNSCEEYPYLQCEEGWVNDKQDVKDLVGIDCGEDEELFLAIASLRDDSDRLQWFIHDDSDWHNDQNIFWHKCESESIKIDMAFNIMYSDCRKATVQELIEHFNK